MLNIAKMLKPWKEAGSLNAQLSLYGFWSDTVTLTKSGDVLMVLSVQGVDYESLDSAEQEYAVRRLESALKAFGEGFHIYQYLFKTNRPEIPFASYGEAVVDAAIDQRRQFFAERQDQLYRVEIFYAVVLEGQRSKTGLWNGLKRVPSDPQGGFGEIRAQFAGEKMKVLLRRQIDADVQKLEHRVEAFRRHLADFMRVEALDQQDQLTFFRRLLNFDEWRIAGRPKATQFLDYQVVNSDIAAERDHLRVGDHYVRLLTMKEAPGETRPMVLNQLLKLDTSFHVVTEWTPVSAAKAKKEVVTRRRHFNMAKSRFRVSSPGEVAGARPADRRIQAGRHRAARGLPARAWVKGRAWVTSPSRSSSMAATWTGSPARPANSPASSRTRMERCTPRPTTS